MELIDFEKVFLLFSIFHLVGFLVFASTIGVLIHNLSVLHNETLKVLEAVKFYEVFISSYMKNRGEK